MPSRPDLRPIERRVLALRHDGMGDAEIGRRFHRGPGFAKQVARLSQVERRALRADDAPALNPLERRVLKWRDRGVRPEEMAWRFRRSPEHIARVERLARYKLRKGT